MTAYTTQAIEPFRMMRQSTDLVTLPSTAFKKNGSFNYRKCGEFYGVRPKTIRTWLECGAPLSEPDRMYAWRDQRNRDRWQKISLKNRAHINKEEEIIRLYVREKLGLRAIAKYFSGRPGTAGVRKVLIRRGVYRGGEALSQQRAISLARRAAIEVRTREARHRVAVCLWKLRLGMGVETTCRERGWEEKSVWNMLAVRRSYKRFKLRQRRRWPPQAQSRHTSRKFLRENAFQNHIAHILTAFGLDYVRECRLPNSRTRVDFKLPDQTFVECKVAVRAGQINEFLGQALQYRAFARRIILCVPPDVQIRADLYSIITELGITVCNEDALGTLLTTGERKQLANQIVSTRQVQFTCKCCQSTERRRYRMNSYCVDCAPRIPEMTFDYKRNRWVEKAG